MGNCFWCGKILEVIHRDHFIPKSVGGKSTDKNLVDSCKSCNSSKNNKLWIKRNNKIIFDKKKTFVKGEATAKAYKIIISNVYTIKRTRGKIKDEEYSHYGEEINSDKHSNEILNDIANSLQILDE